MDQSFSDSDTTMSPSQILERLQMLRQLQILQRSKLQKQINFQNSTDLSKSITEIVSHFSDSTSYNTFRSLLQSPRENATEQSVDASRSHRDNLGDIVDGVTLLNLSQESEFINASPSSTQSAEQNKSKYTESNEIRTVVPGNQISLDEMPILSPKKDFEALLLEKIRREEKTSISTNTNISKAGEMPKKVKLVNIKKPFLKRGEGMARFGINKDDLVIQNTKALPWKRGDHNIKQNTKPKIKKNNTKIKHDLKMQVLKDEIRNEEAPGKVSNEINKIESQQSKKNSPHSCEQLQEFKIPCINGQCEVVEPRPLTLTSNKKDHLLSNCKGKTWASVLSKEQNDLLTKLKQSDYYKNFLSPTKSIISDISCDENMSKLRQEKEVAEQNLFELIENKVSHDSFHFENSFFNRFLGKTALESSGESTPLIMKKTITNNPKLMNISPSISVEHQYTEDTCDCEECNESSSSVSCCCSCKTMTDKDSTLKHDIEEVSTVKNKSDNNNDKINTQNECHNDVSNDASTNMADMNAKLIATSELLKERLKELEDEIETFRKENANLTKMREEIEQEKQTFFQEKQEYEKKFNEEKILSEYYMAEEKEKLQKQKQLCERYVRDMRGRINKREKDEVVNLKKEIQDLKEEIRLKDAKSTTAMARLRNQIKIMEKEKKNNLEEIEKLKKENRRIQHSNDITRRLTNIKYLEQINKKLHNMSTKDSQVEVDLDSDIKYKAHAIERQSRPKNLQQNIKTTMRPRAKSVPNLKVTSRYAKYFSQKDALSDMEKYKVINYKDYANNNDYSDEDIIEEFDNKVSDNSRNLSVNDDDNNLEKLYNERFKASLPSETKIHTSPDTKEQIDVHKSEQNSNYFINKNTNDYINRNSIQQLKSSYTGYIHPQKSPTVRNNSKSPTFFPNYSTSSGISTHNSENTTNFNDNEKFTDIRSSRTVTVNNVPTLTNLSLTAEVQTNFNNRMTPSPEPSTSKERLSKTNLNPTEVIKPDGTKELRFPNGNIKVISADGKYSKFIYYNGDIKENFYNEGRIRYFYAENKTIHTTHADGLEVLEFPDGQTEKRYKDGSSEIKLPNGSIRYFDPKNTHVREEWRFPDGATLTVSANGEQRIVFPNGQIEVHTKDHKRREFPDGTVKLIYNDGTSETRYSSGRVRIKDKHGNLLMDSAPG